MYNYKKIFILLLVFLFVFNSCETDSFKNSDNKADINYSKELISDEKSAKKYADLIINEEFNIRYSRNPIESIKTRIQGTDTISFRLAEAMVNKAGLGLAWRLDAAKDVMDQDAVRNGDTSFDDTWQNVIDFWKHFVQEVNKENPNSYIVSEITDMEELVKFSTGERVDAYNNIPGDFNFKSVPDAMIKFFNE